MTGCPACGKPLRLFVERWCCDACEGIFLAVADLARSIDELVRIECAIEAVRERAGARGCPSCGDAMRRCHLRLAMLDQVLEPEVELDRCPSHGVWFDDGKLARVFLAVEREFGAHGGTRGPTGPGDDGPLGTYGKFKR